MMGSCFSNGNCFRTRKEMDIVDQRVWGGDTNRNGRQPDIHFHALLISLSVHKVAVVLKLKKKQSPLHSQQVSRHSISIRMAI